MYTCGPTVYDFAHIGNFRTYTTADILVRTLKVNKLNVKYVMNVTDVGHLTGDNLGDADTGEDRMEKSAKKEGKTAWEVAKFYTDAFLTDFKKLNLTQPAVIARATDHIKEQIELVKRLEDEGYTYQTSDGIYFDTSRFKDYGKLSNLDQIKEGARVEINVEKKNPRDFALWKFSYPNGKTYEEFVASFDKTQDDDVSRRQMEWESPWGVGFPGWHIECSAMALKYLTDSFDPFDKLRVNGEFNRTIDIHAGGIDLRETHHPNEIAQAEAVTHKPFATYWVHSAFMLVTGERMSKSLGNNYKIYDLEKEGFSALDLRYLYLQTHYRQEMNFTFASLEAAKNALEKLKKAITTWPDGSVSQGATSNEGRNSPQGEEGAKANEEFQMQFLTAIHDDLNTSQALSVLWEMVKSELPDSVKLPTLFWMDEVLGLGMKDHYLQTVRSVVDIPPEVRLLIEERNSARKGRHYVMADQLRNKIQKLGYDIQDAEDGTTIKKLS